MSEKSKKWQNLPEKSKKWPNRHVSPKIAKKGKMRQNKDTEFGISVV